jgi:hypothetical protein
MMSVVTRRERADEKCARIVVARALGARVVRYENGERDRMVDAAINYWDGRSAGLEVVQDTLRAWRAQRAAIQARAPGMRLEIEKLTASWMVQLERRTSVDALLPLLPDFLHQVQRDHRWYDSRFVPPEVAERMRNLGIARLSKRSDKPFSVLLRTLGSEGPWRGPDSLCDWLEQMMAEQDDVTRKLLEHEPADERHAFVWATMTSDITAHLMFEAAATILPARTL